MINFFKPFTFCAASVLMSCSLDAQYEFPFQDPDLSVDVRAENILSLLSLEEKLHVIRRSEVPRLNIPAPGSAESIHQVVSRGGFGTGDPIPTSSFAQVVGLGSTWNPELIQSAGSAFGYEARYISQSEKYNRNTLMLWGPSADLARDPRWGRNDESFSEDPYLTSAMAVAFIKGLQGDHPKYWQAGSLLKHFVANSNETDRAKSSSDFDERLMYEYYAVPFRRGFTEGGAKSYMTAYNAWNGVPMLVHPMLREVVGDKWGADWIVSTDAGSPRHAVEGHKYLDTLSDVYAAAIKSGINQYLDFSGIDEIELIKKALAENLIDESDIDVAVVGKLKTAIKLGLIDPPELNPYSEIGSNNEAEPWLGDKHKSIALNVAREAIVLLKNEQSLLPIDKEKTQTIAVIGNRAEQVLFDFYSGPTPYSVSVLAGLENSTSQNTTIKFVGNGDDAISAAGDADYVIVVVGNDPMCGTKNPMEAFNSDGSTKPCVVPGEGREGRDRTSIELPTESLIKEVYAANSKTIVVLVSSFPYAINWTQENVPAILHIPHAAQEQGSGLAEVLFGEYNPAGRLVQTWPKSLEQLPPLMDYDLRNGRTYLYQRDEPLYSFGYGLSYTDFKYSNLHADEEVVSKDGSVKISVEIKNIGKFGGDEVAQFYVQHLDSKVIRPIKSLKAFERIKIKAGETKTVKFLLDVNSLAWWNQKKQDYEVESGKIKLLIGASSADIKLEKIIQVQ